MRFLCSKDIFEPAAMESDILEQLILLRCQIVWSCLCSRLVIAHMSRSELCLWDWIYLAPIVMMLNQYYDFLFDEYYLLMVATVCFWPFLTSLLFTILFVVILEEEKRWTRGELMQKVWFTFRFERRLKESAKNSLQKEGNFKKLRIVSNVYFTTITLISGICIRQHFAV